jgi:hypothetical protein
LSCRLHLKLTSGSALPAASFPPLRKERARVGQPLSWRRSRVPLPIGWDGYECRGPSSGGLRWARRPPLPQDANPKLLSQAPEVWHPTEVPCEAEGSAIVLGILRLRATARGARRRAPLRMTIQDWMMIGNLLFEGYSSNMGTWRWSSVGPRRGRRVAPITARTVSDSRAVRGTKMRWVLERWSGGFTR